MTPPSLTPQYRGAAISIVVHVLALLAGVSLLGAAFEFPDILRQPAPYRLELYLRNQSTIQSGFWILAMTGFTQIAMSVFLYRSFRERDSAVLSFALVFGILAGMLQTMGFIGWAIVMPYLATQMADPAASAITREAVALVEGAFNQYAGVALGEHTANICLGLWTGLLAIAMARVPLVDRRLAVGGIFVAPLALVLALGQLGVSGWLLDLVTVFGSPLWVVWLVLIGVSLLRTDGVTGDAPPMTWRTVLGGGLLYCAMVILSLFP
jgi:hypothetical protein